MQPISLGNTHHEKIGALQKAPGETALSTDIAVKISRICQWKDSPLAVEKSTKRGLCIGSPQSRSRFLMPCARSRELRGRGVGRVLSF
jgi:hypothetical protein